MSKTLTAIINTKNEEKHISACIESMLPLKAEILVADMHSTDTTVQKAKAAGARVISVEDYGYVEPARMKAIEAAKTPWILLLDADERLTPELCITIHTIIAKNEVDAVQFPFKNYAFGVWMQHGMRWPDYHIRLFKKGSVVWSPAIHSQATYTGKTLQLPATEKNAIVHYNVANISQLIQKIHAYTAKERWYDEQQSVTHETILQRIANEFPWRYHEHKGKEDGIVGYIMAKSMEYYRFLEFLHYWERTGYKKIGKDKVTWELAQSNTKMKQELQEMQDSLLFKVLWKPYKKLTSFVIKLRSIKS